MPDNIISINEYAFSECYSLTNLSLSSKLQNIGSWAFYNCVSLESIRLPNGIESIEEYTFYGCSSLKEIMLPSGLKEICDLVFCNCNSLSSVDVHRTSIVPNTSNTAFRGVNLSLATLLTSKQNSKLYSDADIWKDFGNKIEKNTILGDLDSNGFVDKKDVTIMVNYLLGNSIENTEFDLLDLNNSGSVTIADLKTLLSIMNK